MNFNINIGGLIYNIDSLTNEFYQYNAKCFECETNENAHLIKVTQHDLDNFSLVDTNLNTYSNETVYILDKIVRHCLDYNRMIIHGACISYKNNGYLFIAPSKTGKTTHIKLWKQYLNDQVIIINGDKPMLEFKDEIIIHSTPFMGKEGYGSNTSSVLKAIIVLKQDKNNQFRKLNVNESLSSLMMNSFYSIDKECGQKVINYISQIIEKVPLYELKCDISKQAFETCFNGLIKKASI